MYIVDKNWDSAAENLAYESCLMNELASMRPDETILYLWQNRDTVVIGRNQNPYKECDIDALKKSGTELVRRVTGGGAVYHDLGNLNYSFFCHKEFYSREKVFAYILEALASLGVLCRLSGRNDILLDGLKISGNAFYQKKDVVLHHGTIMVNVDVERMKACLTPDKAKLNSKGISSVAARVGNLADIREDIDVAKVKDALIHMSRKYFDVTSEILSIDGALFADMTKKFSSKEWTYGNYPEDYETVSGKFDWGSVVMGFVLEGTIIERCYIESDSLYPDEISSFEGFIKGMDLRDIRSQRGDCKTDCDGDIKRRIYEDLIHLIGQNRLNGTEQSL